MAVTRNPEAPHHAASGISLYTLLAAVVVLGVLGSALVTQFTGDNAKLASLAAQMRNIGMAVNRFHLDTGCYPTTIGAMMTRQSADRNNTCETALSDASWQGPYLDPMPLTQNGGLQSNIYKPNQVIYMGYQVSSGGYGGANNRPVVAYSLDQPKDEIRELVAQLGVGFYGVDFDGPSGKLAYRAASD